MLASNFYFLIVWDCFMRKPVLTIFYQFDPWHSTIGGIQTIIANFLKYAPDEFELRVVGTASQPDQAVGKWQEANFADRAVWFMPLFRLQNDNVRKIFPTTLRYTAALLGHRLSSDFMHFHRLEPTLAALPWSGDKTLFVHNDIRKQIQHRGNSNAMLWQRFPKAYFLLERLLIGQFDQILSCNAESVKLYQERYSALLGQISHIRNTVDTDTFYPLSTEERQQARITFAHGMGLPEDTKFVLFAGRLHPQKDPVLLVRAIAALADPGVHLLIAGDGELAPTVRSEVERAGIYSHVTLLGPLAQAQLANLHQIVHVFALTSTHEGMPLVVLESLACGTPVVTTRCGDTPNLLTADSGGICQERTAVAVADKLRQVLQHPEHYSAEACVRVAQPFSARSVIRDVYDDMLQRWDKRISLSTA
ncbi:glycosyltransferase [Leptolyngbya sp. NK1-12]